MNYYRKGDFEITKREVLMSIAIIAVMFLFGFMIHGKISDNLMEDYQKYDTAVQIDKDSEIFTYGMKTDIGYAFVYGDLKAVDTVTFEEIDGQYSYVKKVKERYTKHTRTVTKTRTKSDGTTETYTEEEEYWTWDEIDSWSKHSQQISFLNVIFPYGKISFPSYDYITTQKESYYIRYVYYGTGIEFKGTLFANLGQNTINDVSFYFDKSIEDTIEGLESGIELIGFWIFWILLMGGCVFGFCYLDNKWLEDKR